MFRAIQGQITYLSVISYPSYDVLVKLARIFHVSTDYLLGMTDKRNIDVTGLSDNVSLTKWSYIYL